MNGNQFDQINLDELALKCLSQSDDVGDYWDKCSNFVLSLKNKTWNLLTYKQVNWLQDIVREFYPDYKF